MARQACRKKTFADHNLGVMNLKTGTKTLT